MGHTAAGSVSAHRSGLFVGWGACLLLQGARWRKQSRERKERRERWGYGGEEEFQRRRKWRIGNNILSVVYLKCQNFQRDTLYPNKFSLFLDNKEHVCVIFHLQIRRNSTLLEKYKDYYLNWLYFWQLRTFHSISHYLKC